MTEFTISDKSLAMNDVYKALSPFEAFKKFDADNISYAEVWDALGRPIAESYMNWMYQNRN